MISVFEGEGTVDGKPVKKGMNFIIPSGYGSYTVKGDLEFMVSGVK